MNRHELIVSPSRERWLIHLRDAKGFVEWNDMPRSRTGLRAIDNRTWGPMVDAGWIEAEFRRGDETTRAEWLFKITDAGLAALSQPATQQGDGDG